MLQNMAEWGAPEPVDKSDLYFEHKRSLWAPLARTVAGSLHLQATVLTNCCKAEIQGVVT
ncbi:hypothetical protein EAH77_04375 [Ewingella americana]|uniref:Uncharacterized protein n=1 Tax=Ewingella americana TaxID=41202 RepID=A0A502GP09_9GAMM|nr:hypothetical protein EAH77_04375 [Ewingella americana]